MVEITYHKEGIYLIPDLYLEENYKNDYQIGKYGYLRLQYLKKHKKSEYTIMLLDGTLNTHLKEIQEQATLRVEQIIKQLKDNSDLTEEMKNLWFNIHN